MDRTQQLEEEIQRLSRTIEEMRGRMERLESGGPSDDSKRSRRGFLRMGMAAAAGALGWAAVKAVPAAAATGSNLVLGNGNVAENTTVLQDDSAGGLTSVGVLNVESKHFDATNLADILSAGKLNASFDAPVRALGDTDTSVPPAPPSFVDGIDAWANGPAAYAVYGVTDTGTGVVGEAYRGIGLYAAGTGRIRQRPQGNAGTPLYSPDLMEQVRDSNGILYIHNGSGAWRRVNTLRVDAADGSGNPFTPIRIYDTRTLGGPKAAGNSYSVPITGGGGSPNIPADAIAVTGNLTATGFSSAGYLTLYPGGTAKPPTSSINYSAGQTAIANSFVCGLGAGAINVFVGAAATHFIVDITGYIQ